MSSVDAGGSCEPLVLRPPRFGRLFQDQILFSVQLITCGTAYFFADMMFGRGARASWGFIVPCLVAALVLWLTMKQVTAWRMQRVLGVRDPNDRIFELARDAAWQGAAVELPLLDVRRVTGDCEPPAVRRLLIERDGFRFGRGAPLRSWRDVVRVDWTLTGVEIDLGSSRLVLKTGRPPLIFGPLDHFPFLRHRVQGAVFQLMSFNQRVAQLLEVRSSLQQEPLLQSAGGTAAR